MKKPRFRLLSVFLTMAVLLVSLQIYAVPGNQTNGSPTEPEDHPRYPYRMPEEEPNLYTLVYRIDDELCSMEVYDTPVKFKDKDGKVKDILPEIEETDTGFRTRQSSIAASFPSDISDGINLSYKNLSICEKPQFDAEEGTLSADGTKLTYSVSDNTFLEYSLTYTGYKENIVVSEYTGQTDYSFVYYTNGLALESTYGTVLFSDEDGKAVAYLGEIIVFTADEKNNFFGDLEIEEITFREEYRVTVVLDGEKLASDLTAYPITIDPEINIIYEESGANALEDATINSLSGTSGSATSLHVGPRNTYGISRILMRFPGLDLSPVSYPDQIVSANLRVRDLMCYGTHLTVNCHVFNPVWGESTVSWANTSPNNYNSAILDSHEIYYNNGNYVAEGYTYSNVYHFDVTDAVQSWVTNYTGKYSGIILKATDTFENSGTKFAVTLGSYERASNKPKLLITYSRPEDGQYYIVSADYGKYLHSGGSVDATSGTIAALGNTIRFELKGTANGKYSIRPLNQTNKYIGRTDGTSLGLVTCADPDSIPDECLWTLSGNKIRCTVSGTTYYLKAIGAIVYLTSDSSAIGIDWYRAKTDYYGNTSAFPKRELESDFSVANLTLQVGEAKTPVINKSPSNALWAEADMFDFTCISSSPTGCVTCNNQTHTITGVYDGTATISATHKITGLSKQFTVSAEFFCTINEKTAFYLKSGLKYLEIPSDPDGVNSIQQGLGNDIQVKSNSERTDFSHQLWEFVRIGNSKNYAICSTHSNNQFIVAWSDNVTTYTSSYSKYSSNFQNIFDSEDLWNISFQNGYYRISVASDSTKYLYIDSNGNAKVQSGTLSDGFVWNISEMIFQTIPNTDEYYLMWNGRCCANSAPSNVVVAVDMQGTYRNYNLDVRTFDTTVISFNQIKAAVESWNNISDNVSITCKTVSQLDSEDVLLAVIADGETNGQNPPFIIGEKINLGLTVPVKNGTERPLTYSLSWLNDNWDHSIIYLSTELYCQQNVSTTEIVNAIKHEIGHALKLKHPVDLEETNPSSACATYPSIMQAYGFETDGITYLGALSQKASEDFTVFDYTVLKRRWG